MSRTLGLCKRLMKQMVRDRRSMALLFFAPLVVLALMSAVLTTSATQSTLDSVKLPPAMVEKLKETDADVHEVSQAEAERRLADGDTDGYLSLADGKLHVVLEGSDPAVNGAVMAAVREMQQKMAPTANAPEITYIYGGSSLTSLDYFAPVLIGFFIFFFVFLFSGVAFLRERTGGTLERMLATPIRRHEIVFGYFLGFGLFAVLQTAFVQWFALHVMDVQSVGSFWQVLVTNILVATVALSLGTLLSAFARNEFQMVQFIPLVVVPQIFLSGMFDTRNFPDWLTALSQVLPLTHAAEVLRGLMIRGQSLADHAAPLGVLLGYCVLFLALNVLVLKRYRRV